MHTTLLVPRDVPGLTLVVNWPQHAPLLTVAAQLALRGPVQVVVGGNRFDTQQLARIVRMQTTAVDETLARIQLARPYFVAQLLAGEMPQEIEEAFQAARPNLLPGRRELKQNCNCPDWADVFKHLADLHYILAERFDEDPFLLFRLRGKTQEEILASLARVKGKWKLPCKQF